jgi:hypothetical protein
MEQENSRLLARLEFLEAKLQESKDSLSERFTSLKHEERLVSSEYTTLLADRQKRGKKTLYIYSTLSLKNPIPSLIKHASYPF